MTSSNIADENFRKLAALFPNAVTETIDEKGEVVRAIDKDALMQEIAVKVVDGKEERYQFTWPDKRKSVLLANAPTTKTLRPCREESVEFDTTENLYLEGDNLDVLKILQETYRRKIKTIYIDPPYNTGGDFVYNDVFAESVDEYLENSGQYDEEGNRLFVNTESNGRFHTDWLNMIYPRLKIAKNLLADDGVIFISVDDNEACNLKKIADELFGASNFVGQITVVGNPSGRDYGGVARMHDYLFVYKKSPLATINLIEDADNKFQSVDSLGGFELRELRNRNIKFNQANRPNLYYPFYISPADVDEHGLHAISLEPQDGWLELYPLESQGVKTVWRWGKPKARANLNVNIKAKGMKNGRFMIVEKYRESRRMARSVWWDKETITEKGTRLLKELMEGKAFDYPKPLGMLTRILEMGTSPDKDDIVLDFFSGSGTTAHATMQLNATDGGSRKFIMVQLPEQTEEKSEARKAGFANICEIGKERIRRAGAKLKSEAGTTSPNLDVGFRVLKCDSSNMKDVYYRPRELEQATLEDYVDNVKEDRTPEDLLFQVMLELGFLLSSKIVEETIQGVKVFNVADGALYACFDDRLAVDVVRSIAEKAPRYAVFHDSASDDDATITNVNQIFAAISPATIRKRI